MNRNNDLVKKGEIFNCEIKSLSVKGKNVFLIQFKIVKIQELADLIFNTNIKSNWTLIEVLRHYKYNNNKFQAEFDGIDEQSQNPIWILRKVN